jgi:LysR family glycine cleavage system transcriptional activator
MNHERKLLPPMAALNSFAAAARYGSFSRAGMEVGLTQSAISRQIALLEDWLQTPLFTRTGRRVTLNADGKAYAENIGLALDRIRRATARLSDRRPENALSIATLPSFGMRWLAPRLPGLTALHPELIVDFAARSFSFSFADVDFDAAIHFGRPDWPGAYHDFLFRETVIPVCSPGWLRENPVVQPSDLSRQTLLLQTSRLNAWRSWFNNAGVEHAIIPPGPTFEHFLMLAHAAVAGAGVALIPSFLIEPELSSGALISPIDLPLVTDEAYYLVYPEEIQQRPALQHFRDWLICQTQEP